MFIIIDPDVFLGAILPDLSKWFNTSDVEYKREDIANLIKEVASQDKSRKVKFPKIKMPSREEKEEDRKKRPGMFFVCIFNYRILNYEYCHYYNFQIYLYAFSFSNFQIQD